MEQKKIKMSHDAVLVWLRPPSKKKKKQMSYVCSSTAVDQICDYAKKHGYQFVWRFGGGRFGGRFNNALHSNFLTVNHWLVREKAPESSDMKKNK